MRVGSRFTELVIDAADPERAERITQVNEVLESIGAS